MNKIYVDVFNNTDSRGLDTDGILPRLLLPFLRKRDHQVQLDRHRTQRTQSPSWGDARSDRPDGDPLKFLHLPPRLTRSHQIMDWVGDRQWSSQWMACPPLHNCHGATPMHSSAKLQLHSTSPEGTSSESLLSMTDPWTMSRSTCIVCSYSSRRNFVRLHMSG